MPRTATAVINSEQLDILVPMLSSPAFRRIPALFFLSYPPSTKSVPLCGSPIPRARVACRAAFSQFRKLSRHVVFFHSFEKFGESFNEETDSVIGQLACDLVNGNPNRSQRFHRSFGRIKILD